MKFFCCDDGRRAAALRDAQVPLNGIEFLEVLDDHDDPPELRQRTLFVNFLKPLTPSGQPGALTVNNVLIEGGERLPDVRVNAVTAGAFPNCRHAKRTSCAVSAIHSVTRSHRALSDARRSA
jgi:hypothetical protein